MTTFFYEDGQENLFNEHGEKVYDPMEDVLTQIDDPNIVLETITNRETYLSAKRPEKATGEPSVTKPLKSSNLTKSTKSYSIYSDTTRESFIDRMLEQPQERGLVAKVARELNVKYRTALNWWHIYEETEGVPYKNSEKNSGPKSSFTTEHNEYITKLLDNDPQIFADDIINSLTEQFEGFTISKSQMNNHLHEAGFHINMRLNWARSKSGKKPSAVTEISGENTEVNDDSADNNSVKKGTTTAHFVKFMNEVLAVLDAEEAFEGSYIVLDNASIHKSKPMIRKIESKGYRVMYLPPYSPELNPIEQFWAIVKGKMKRDRLMNEENLSSRITDACNDILISDLNGFCNHSKRQIVNCYNKTPF
ncbi:hypothetical protein G6F46_012510 [Rhizopus delemar]|nr:hypothetical protein G6F46_012510 [Rhizopus delemar]